MNFSQWFWKYGYLFVPLAIALIWFVSSDKFQNRGKVNPEIFAVFTKIEQQCHAETFDTQTSQCTEIRKYQTECKKLSASCDSKTFYDLLQKLKFPLPPYILEQ